MQPNSELPIVNHQPHPDRDRHNISCAVITISDTRTTENDQSGSLIQQLLLNAGHEVVFYEIIPDEPEIIRDRLANLSPSVRAVIFNGGTGIAPRDRTYETLEPLLDKVLPGFGEIFRFLSYQEIGSRAIASRAIAGIYQNRIIFSIPGSMGAVKLAMERLIIPEIAHLTQLIWGAKL